MALFPFAMRCFGCGAVCRVVEGVFMARVLCQECIAKEREGAERQERIREIYSRGVPVCLFRDYASHEAAHIGGHVH